MSAVPSSNDREAYLDRRRRMGAPELARPNVVSWASVRRPEPEPEPEPEVDPLTLPSFLGLRERRSEWFDATAQEAFRPANATVILRVVSVSTRIPLLDLVSARRSAKIVRSRMIACWIMRNFTSMSLPQIGAKLGGRDHSTISHSIERVEAMRSSDPSYRALVDNIVATVMESMKAQPA